MRFPANVVTEQDLRPNRYIGCDKLMCGYCKSHLGEPHEAECVCIERPVKIKMTIEMVIAKPRGWDKDSIEFHMNESSWCKDNIQTQLERTFESATKNRGCTCGIVEFQYVGDATMEEAIESGLRPDSEIDDENA